MTRRIVTAEDVGKMEPGGRLVVDENTTVTAPARELARRRGIAVVEGAEPATAADAEQALEEVVAAPAGKPGRIIVTAVGVNRAGVLSEISQAIGGLKGDIQDLSQRITGGYFHALLLVDIAHSGRTFADFRQALLALSKPADYVVTVVDERVFRAMHRV